MSNSSWGKDTAFYRLTPWLRLRESKINDNPICELCESVGSVSEARFIDHILNRILFEEFELEPINLQSLCSKCHSQKTRLERMFQERNQYLKELESGKLQYCCTKAAKEKLFCFLKTQLK